MFERLDYIYMPSRDLPADVAYFTDVLGAELLFAIEGMGTRVAMLYEGRVRQVGTVDEIQHSSDPVVRQFIEGRPTLDPEIQEQQT